MYDNYAQNQFVRFMKWIAEYPDIWNEICQSDHDINAERCCKIIENLESNAMYNLIPILILKNKYTDAMNATINQFVMDCIVKVWEKEGQYALCESFKESLLEWDKICSLRRADTLKDNGVTI